MVSPLAAFAQPVSGSVTTDPVGQSAPALALPMLVVLAVGLIGLGAYTLRTRSAGAVAGFALVAGLSVLAGLGYATDGSVVIQGAECNTQTVSPYPSVCGDTLTSGCSNRIRIVAIEPGCESPTIPSSPCTVGQVLTDGQQCYLPYCAC